MLKIKAAERGSLVCTFSRVHSNIQLLWNHSAEQEITLKNKLFHHLYENVRLS